MCLDTVNYEAKKWDNKGWKIFKVDNDNKIHSPIRNKFKIYPINRWIKDENTGYISCPSGWTSTYPVGFHYFKNKKHALVYRTKGEVALQIKVRNIVATGVQQVDGGHVSHTANVGVTTEMLILPGQDVKPRQTEVY